MESYHRIESGRVSASWKSKLYCKHKVLFDVPESTVPVETYVKTMKSSHKFILESQQMQALHKLWDNKFTPKPAIKKLMHNYSFECMEYLDNIKIGIILNKTAARYSTAMKKKQGQVPIPDKAAGSIT